MLPILNQVRRWAKHSAILATVVTFILLVLHGVHDDGAVHMAGLACALLIVHITVAGIMLSIVKEKTRAQS